MGIESLLDLILYLGPRACITIAKTSCGRQTAAHQSNGVAETGHETWGEREVGISSLLTNIKEKNNIPEDSANLQIN